MLKLRALLSAALAAAACSAAVAPAADAAIGDRAYALSGTQLVGIDPTNGSINAAPKTITGINAGETLVDIAIRPVNGVLYSVGVNATANTATLYAVSPQTGVAGIVGTAGGIAYTTDGATPVDFPDPATVGYGIDFNPNTDRLRLVAGGLNVRINPNYGGVIDGNNNGAPVAGVNPDGSINGLTTTLDAIANTDGRTATTITTQYALDAASNQLFISLPANGGTQTSGQAVTLGGSTINFSSQTGFDIPASVSAPSSNAAVTSGTGYAILNVGGTTALYAINLVNAQATLLGPVGNGSSAYTGLAVPRSYDDGHPLVRLTNGPGSQLLRDYVGAPSNAFAAGTGAPAAGETLVSIAWRPATGQLLGLGVDPVAEEVSLYLVDPIIGLLIAIGAGGNQLSSNGITPVDLPAADPSWGFDVNPAADRIRVVAPNGVNFRINPNTGAVVDTDLGLPGNQPDQAINGEGVGLNALAYTNAFGGATTTTLYGLDTLVGKLFIQTPPNNGTLSSPIAVTTSAATLTGFDIPSGVTVATSNAAVTRGKGYVMLQTVAGPRLSSVDLVTGQLADLPDPTGSVRSLAVGETGLDLKAPAAPSVLTPVAGASVTAPFGVGGTGEAAAIATVREGAGVLCTATVGPTGSWSCPITALADGSHTLTVTLTDDAGNESAATTLTITSTPPASGGPPAANPGPTPTPAPAKCTLPKTKTLKLPKGARLAKVTVAGKKLKLKKGKDGRQAAKISLRGKTAGKFTVKISYTTKAGKKVKQTKKLTRCAA